MRYFIIVLLATCNTYQGIVVSNHEFTQTSRCKITDTFYIVVTGYYEEGDTLYINKTDLRVLR